MSINKVTVLVAGSWGTALASVLAENNADVTLWSRNEQQVREINELHTNHRFLPKVTLHPAIKATNCIETAITGAKAIIFVPPSSAMRDLARKIKPYVTDEMTIAHATKGFEADTLMRMSEVIADEIPQYDRDRVCVLSGPSHAEEVVMKKPTTVVVASKEVNSAKLVQDLFINANFRVYTNPDVDGVELGGALKNIIALGAGMSDGLGFGDNARAALITRGLAEMTRLGVALGANPLTFAGLAGIGDLVVTCTSKHSRNWRAGNLLAQGKKLDEVLQILGMVAEGVKTTSATYEICKKTGIEMPITEQLYGVLFENKSVKLAVEQLMGRTKADELENSSTKALNHWK